MAGIDKVEKKAKYKKSGSLKRAAAMTMVVLTLSFGSCNRQEETVKVDKPPCSNAEKEAASDRSGPRISFEEDETSAQPMDSQKQGEVIGNYQYPENPAEQLRSALTESSVSHGLLLEIGPVQKAEINDREYSKVRIAFPNGNVCHILFLDRYGKDEQDVLVDGKANPSFTMAFKDPDNAQDMISLLSVVLLYLSPGLSLQEAERLAVNQNGTISTDGYAMPQDIGGYQVQARYTNPAVFFETVDFEARMGVHVRALKRIWRSELDTAPCVEMKTTEDFAILDRSFPYWEDDAQPKVLYADFLVRNIWQGKSYLHGETWVIVDVESDAGRKCSLVLDTWEFPVAYEFGVGQRYRIYIRWDYSVEIIYAVQLSESEQFQSRGEVFPIDYPTDDWRDPLRRIEPEGEGTVCDVSFNLQSQTYNERPAVLEGHGIGEQQWPGDPVLDGYTFLGWYDNKECSGEPYTPDTVIYGDTALYAKWMYTGPGGPWPRAKQGDIEGIGGGDRLPGGQSRTITANGYNMDLPSPKDQRFRWKPTAWRLADEANGGFSGEAPFQAVITPYRKGENQLFITYTEEIYDGTDWQPTGNVYEAEEVAFQIH